MTEFVEKFLACERQQGLFRREIGGICYWHLIRFRLFNDLVLPHFISGGSPHPDHSLAVAPSRGLGSRVAAKLASVRNSFAERLCHDPDRARGTFPILFAMIPRQGVLADGSAGSTMLDPLVGELRVRHALLEHPGAQGRYTDQPYGRKVFHWPEYRAIRDVRLAPDGAFAKAAPARKAESEWLASFFADVYGFTFESGRIWWMIDDCLRHREIYGDAMRRWIARLGVRVLVLSDAEYRNNALLTEAARECRVPVVELQHGTIYPEHLSYNLGERDEAFSPDYLLSWGAHWNGQVRGYPARRTVSAGYPYLDGFRERCRRMPRRDGTPLRVLFVSQGMIGPELSRLAVLLRQSTDQERIDVVYKLHPNETKSWRTLYPELAASGIRVVGNDAMNIYQCLQHADVTVGTNSTAMIEGFAWGVKALVMKNLPAGFTMEAYCRSGAAEFIEDGEHLVRRIGELAVGSNAASDFEFKSDVYFRPGAAKRIAGYLEDLASGKEISE